MTERWLDCDYNVTYDYINDRKISLCLKTEDEDGCDYCRKKECKETTILGELDEY